MCSVSVHQQLQWTCACFCGERTDVPQTEAAVADSLFATGGGYGDHGTIGVQFDHGVWVGRAWLAELIRYEAAGWW